MTGRLLGKQGCVGQRVKCMNDLGKRRLPSELFRTPRPATVLRRLPAPGAGGLPFGSGCTLPPGTHRTSLRGAVLETRSKP